MVEKILIDCDPGLDDARALIYAFNDPNHQIVALTTCTGRVLADKAAYNVGLVATACQKLDVPIYLGNSKSVDGQNLIPDEVYGPSGMGNLEMFEQKHSLNRPVAAATAITSFVNANPNKITIICIGPLTNLAKAIQLDPSICIKVKNLYILGSNRVNVNSPNNPEIEYNAYKDPKAFQTVFSNFGQINRSPIFIFDLTLCRKYTVETEFIHDIASKIKMTESRINEAAILEAISENNENDSSETYIQDITSEFIVTAAYYTDIITNMHPVIFIGIDFGDDLQNQEKKGETTFIDDPTSNTHLVDEIDLEKWKTNFYNVIVNRFPDLNDK